MEYISEKEYLAKPKNLGVKIYPYRVAAAAPFDVHIVPNATQKQLSVVFPRLSFLPKNIKDEIPQKIAYAILEYTLSSKRKVKDDMSIIILKIEAVK